MTKTTPTRVGLAFLGASALVATGFLAGVAYTDPAVPTVLQSATEASTFPVTETAFDDARSVRLAVAHRSSTSLTSPLGGRVTGYACSPGMPIASGTSPLSIDGAPVIALATQTPLWRDLARGDKGDDVVGLQQELERLGHLAAVSGKVDAATIRAFNRLRRTVGETSQFTTTIVVDHVLWLPAATTDVESCSVSVGGTVAATDEIAVVPGTLSSISIVDTPLDLVDGPRTLSIDGTRIQVDPATPITDPTTLQSLETLPSLQEQEEGDEPVTARLELTTPIQVSVVPPSAVIGRDDQSCVQSGGNPASVRVVGSELGQTFVIFDDTPPTVVDVTPSEGAECA
ncbi:peptidoglycan-binding protein [Cellulomonas sp. KRMCY2]|uniref:peptidoglycan-binding domain-containing protein n=1 Tax=Cellulomonas sp. KRMCY2 TaxID=1304865 RepID=UPI00045E9B64|nr:hypothetical protein [Cellulomonas sp. KRMCY2]